MQLLKHKASKKIWRTSTCYRIACVTAVYHHDGGPVSKEKQTWCVITINAFGICIVGASLLRMTIVSRTKILLLVKIGTYMGFCVYRRSCLLWSPVILLCTPRSVITRMFGLVSMSAPAIPHPCLAPRYTPRHSTSCTTPSGNRSTVYSFISRPSGPWPPAHRVVKERPSFCLDLPP